MSATTGSSTASSEGSSRASSTGPAMGSTEASSTGSVMGSSEACGTGSRSASTSRAPRATTARATAAAAHPRATQQALDLAATATREETVSARAAWSRLAEPGDEVAARLVGALGPVAALAAFRTRGESALDRFRPRLERLCVEQDLDNAARVGARVIVPGDADWPSGLDDLAAPPHCLWVRGPADLAALCRSSVAVVGARAATSYGERLAARLASDLTDRGVTVVSGAAYGIDAAAHRGALAAGGPTVAVLACGVERAYPSAHRALLDAVAGTGAVVSEVPPGSAPMRQRFLLRNRLIATMTSATLVVEAGLRSGSRNTAGTAAEHLRVVMATPGPVTSPASAGCHELIRAGTAVLVTDADEILELVGRMGQDAAPRRRGPTRPGDDLDPGDRRVHDALCARPRSVEELAAIVGISVASAQASLGRLGARRAARRVDGGWVMP